MEKHIYFKKHMKTALTSRTNQLFTSCLLAILHTKHLVAKGTRLSPSVRSPLRLEISAAAKHYLTDGIGRCLLSLLVHAVVTRYSPMGSLRFYRLAIWTHQHAGHHAKRAITCKWQSMKYWLRLHESTWLNLHSSRQTKQTSIILPPRGKQGPCSRCERRVPRPSQAPAPWGGAQGLTPAPHPSSVTFYPLWLTLLTYNMGITKHPLNRLVVRIQWTHIGSWINTWSSFIP